VDVSNFSKTEYLLTQLHPQGKRIETLSKLEHELIKEVHPQVSEIKAGMGTVVGVVKDDAENNSLKASNITSNTFQGNLHSMPVTYSSYVKLDCIRLTVLSSQ